MTAGGEFCVTDDTERKALMDRTHALSITRQAQLLGISRANVYYNPVGAAADVLRGVGAPGGHTAAQLGRWAPRACRMEALGVSELSDMIPALEGSGAAGNGCIRTI
jgi:hypothetical protein